MGGLLDTSMTIRYLTGDPPELAEWAASIIDVESDLELTDGVIMETAYVLASVYRVDRTSIVDHLVTLLRKQNISVLGVEKGLILQALLLCRPSGRVSIADAMLWAMAQTTTERAVYTLDHRFPSDGIEVRGR